MGENEVRMTYDEWIAIFELKYECKVYEASGCRSLVFDEEKDALIMLDAETQRILTTGIMWDVSE